MGGKRADRGNVAEWEHILKTRKYPDGFYRCSKCKYITTPKKKKDWCPKCNAIMRN